MKHQLQTIREALEFFECGSYSTSKALTAITAFAQLEAMVGEQEPVSGVVLRDDWPTLLLDRDIKPTDERLYRATPPAQQPQRCPLCNYQYGHAIGCENNPVDIALKARAAQQPQAEPFGYVSQHTNGSWEFSPTPAGVYPDTAKSITAVYTKQPQTEAHQECDSRPICRVLKSCAGQYGSQRICSAAPQQAEAVPPGFALVPVEPTEAVLRALIDCQDADPEDGPMGEADALYRAMLAAAQGEKP